MLTRCIQSFGLLFCGNCFDEPLHSVAEAFLGEGGAGLDVPSSILDFTQFKSSHHFVSVHSELQILLVRVHEQGHSREALLAQKRSEFLVALLETHVISGIDDVDEAVSVIVVVLPVGADLALTADVPHVELEAVLSLCRVGKESER